jgi:hypothetical protein
MTTYAVYCPKDAAPEETPERLAFIRQRMSFWALVLPPVWIVARGLWLTLIFWLAAASAIIALMAKLNPGLAPPAFILFALWFALSARDFEEATFIRRGWRLVGLVEARGLREAEARFFADLVEDAPPAAPPAGGTSDRAGLCTAPRVAAGTIVGFEGFGKDAP